jgi:hypothetical protein
MHGYVIGLDSYYSCPGLFEVLSGLETHAIGTVRCDRKGLSGNAVGKKLKKAEVEVSLEEG